MMKKQVMLLLSVFLVSNLALSTLIIGLSNRAQKQRTTNNELLQRQEENTKQSAIAVRAFECILIIEPSLRDQNRVDQCKKEAARQYNE